MLKCSNVQTLKCGTDFISARSDDLCEDGNRIRGDRSSQGKLQVI